MQKKPYNICNENGKVIETDYFVPGTQPENSTDVPCTIAAIDLYFNFQTNEYYDGASQEAIALQMLQEETLKYNQRMQDGISQVAMLSARLRLAKLTGVITEEGHKHIDKLLIPIRIEITSGQWISGRDLLIELGSESIGEDFYNELLGMIDDYITQNY